MILMIGSCRPRNPLRQWLKPEANADVAHYVVWRSGDELRAGCRTRMDARQAVSARCGVRLCEVCYSNLRRTLKNARKQQAR